MIGEFKVRRHFPRASFLYLLAKKSFILLALNCDTFLFCFIYISFLHRVFVADTLNFSFWSDDESQKYRIKFNGKEYTGYWSWCAALNRALKVRGHRSRSMLQCPHSDSCKYNNHHNCDIFYPFLLRN